jgi:hypothetical protein
MRTRVGREGGEQLARDQCRVQGLWSARLVQGEVEEGWGRCWAVGFGNLGGRGRWSVTRGRVGW